MCDMEGLPANYPEGHSNTLQGHLGRMAAWLWEGPVSAILGTLGCKKLLKTFLLPAAAQSVVPSLMRLDVFRQLSSFGFYLSYPRESQP